MSFLLNDEIIAPAMLTGYVRTALFDYQRNQYTLSRWLPNVVIDDVQYEFMKGQQGLADAAVYRSFDTESRIGKRESLNKVMGELPPISQKMVLNEYDRIRLRKLTDEQVMPFVTRDAQRLTRNIAARFEIARADAIFNGKVTINENGVNQVIDFNRSGSQSVVAAILWTDSENATPLDDLDAWTQAQLDKNGVLPGAILISRQDWATFRRTKQVRSQAFPSASAATQVATAEQTRLMLDSLDLPPMYVYDERVQVNGVTQRVTPAGKIALLPAPGDPNAASATDLGATVMGTTVEAMEGEYGLQPGEQPGIVAAMYKSTDPSRLWTHAVAIGVPIVGEPDHTFIAQVA